MPGPAQKQTLNEKAAIQRGGTAHTQFGQTQALDWARVVPKAAGALAGPSDTAAEN